MGVTVPPKEAGRTEFVGVTLPLEGTGNKSHSHQRKKREGMQVQDQSAQAWFSQPPAVGLLALYS